MKSPSTVFVVTQDPLFQSQVAALVRGLSLESKTSRLLVELHSSLEHATGGCLVVDLATSSEAGRLFEHALSSQQIELPVLALVPRGDVQAAVRAMKAGAMDVLEKPVVEHVLLDRLEQALLLESTSRCHNAGRQDIARRIGTLTTGERAVMDGVVAGKANKVIASQLGFSLRTIELWRRNVMTKLQADSVADLVRLQLQAEGALACFLPTGGSAQPAETVCVSDTAVRAN